MTQKQYIKKTYNVNTLLSAGSTNTKTAKNEIKTFILYMAPAKENNKNINLCPHASKGCLKACLNTAGRGKFTNVQKARRNKANFFVNDKKLFLETLLNEIKKHIKKANDEKIAFRLNGTTDIDFVFLFKKYFNFSVKDLKSNVIFYDYTPNLNKAIRYKDYINYYITFSRKEDNQENVIKALNNGLNVAVVFDKLPKTYLAHEVINGDLTDLEMIKHNNKILGLIAKGKAKKDKSNFVVITK